MKFIFDENLPRDFAIGLTHFGQDVKHVLDFFPQGKTDTEILEFVGDNGYYLVTKDNRIRYHPNEFTALRNHNVGAFFLVGKQMKSWEIVKQLVLCWDDVLEISKTQHKPFIYKIKRRGKPERFNF